MDDLVITDGLHYKKFFDVPFTGEVTGKGQGKIRNGKRDGPWVIYYDNGRIEKRETYKDGKKDGPWVSYHFNGRLRWEGTYKDGNRDGPWVDYNRYGTVDERYTGTYKDGEKVD